MDESLRFRKEGRGRMTVQEAGRRGGLRTLEHGRDFYEDIGRKGGQREKELIEEGKKAKVL
ncbi:Uncharacterised protein [uncultured archaeon]|nr:Uncharacterised protein [uncultured archaeon]